MKLKHDLSLSRPISIIQSDETGARTVSLNRVQCLSISPNLLKLAACFASSNYIVLYDLIENEEKDKFALKASGKSATGGASAVGGRKSFVVTGMAFSADSEKLAIGQSDCVIFVYRIGQTWTEKKSIVNKFNLTSPVATLSWLPQGIVFSSIDGRIKFIQMQNNKMFSLLSSNSICVSLSCSGVQIVAGFSTGHILTNSINARESAARTVLTHSCPPVALVLTSTQFIAAGGSDGRIVFLELTAQGPGLDGTPNASAVSSSRARSVSSSTSNASGGPSSGARQTIEWGADLSNAIASPSGTIVFFSSRDNLVMFELEARTWKHKITVNLNGSLLITGLAWSVDGTKLVTSSLNGSIELFKCRWKSKLLGSRFEVNYIGVRQIVINDLESKITSMFTAQTEIRDVKIIKQNFVIIWTAATLIMASLSNPKARSEIEWHGLTTEGVKFSFDYENVVLISAIGELFLIELGQDKILGSVRTDFISPHLLSVRINERKTNSKVFAYLLDVKTICVIDLTTGLQICTWAHSERIDWMELNETGSKLIYRDKALKLILLNIVNQEFVALLTANCGFVQWVPMSDVIVAQCKEKLYIWYDFTKPIIHSIGGGEQNEAVEIERADGKTKVIMAMPNTDILLDEVLLEFDTAIDDGDLERAESFLESLTESSPNGSADTNSMWLLLGNIALKNLNLSVGERAFAAIGDVAKVSFISACQRDSSLIALLDNDFDRFEAGGDFDRVLQTYLQTFNWERAIQFARRHGRSDLVDDIQSKYYNWLLETGQNSIAAQILEKSGKIEEAIALYLKAGRMFAVSKLILNSWDSPNHSISPEMVRRVIDELNRKEAFEEAGDLYQLPLIDNKEAALAAFIKGHAYAKAIQLARKDFPDEVVNLENQYGEYLLHESNDPSNAVNHFIEAGKTERALEAAISARQFDRAAEIASIIDNVPSYYGKKIAEHYAAKEEIESALEMYLNSGCIRDAVQMLNDKGQYARAYKIAAKLMDGSEAKEMYEYIAKGYESEGKYREAEKIYIACGDVDSAISMYKTAKAYESMIRLVKQYHPNLLTETSIYLAKELENERLYKQAETYYVSVQEWKLAALMYKNAELWEDAYRVSRAHGGAVAAKQVAYHWAQTMQTPADAVNLLNRYGLLNQVVDYAIETNSFDFALSLIIASGSDLKHKLIDVRLKYALWLEMEGHYNEAEAMFVEANKPKEAVVMYLHANAFDEALRVAETLIQDDEVVKDVLTAHARYLFERDRANSGAGDNSGQFSATLSKVESLLLRAGRIEVAIRLYKDVGLWNEAVRACEQYAPHMIDSLKREMISEARESSEMYYANVGRDESSGLSGKMSAQQQQQQQTVEPVSAQVDLYQSLKVAEQNDDKESMIRFSVLIATQLLKDRLTLDSLKALQKHDSVFILADSKKLLSRIAVILLSELEDFTWAGTEESEDNRMLIYGGLRDCFVQLLTVNTGMNSIERDLFEKYLLISHYLTLKSILEGLIREPNSGGEEKNNLTNVRELHLKITVSLLRYSDVIRADKAFYEAGVAARDAGRLEMAFVFFNHFLDLLDAIEERDYNVDHSDFVGTDIPFEVPLPTKMYYEDDVTEDIKSWILQMSMDTELSQTLPFDPLRDGEVYEASLKNADGSKCLPCLVTGYPVIRHKMIEFTAGKYVANKEDWNKLLMLTKITENTELRKVLHFIGRICGNSAVVKFSFQ